MLLPNGLLEIGGFKLANDGQDTRALQACATRRFRRIGSTDFGGTDTLAGGCGTRSSSRAASSVVRLAARTLRVRARQPPGA